MTDTYICEGFIKRNFSFFLVTLFARIFIFSEIFVHVFIVDKLKNWESNFTEKGQSFCYRSIEIYEIRIEYFLALLKKKR